MWINYSVLTNFKINFTYLKNKTDSKPTVFLGNSLWKIGALKESDLLEKINGYKDIETVINDFNC